MMMLSSIVLPGKTLDDEAFFVRASDPAQPDLASGRLGDLYWLFCQIFPALP